MKQDIFNQKVDQIGLDYDDLNITAFLFNYFRVKKDFPKTKIETEMSSSARGLHIRIHKKCTILENFKYRTLYNDDLLRLGLSLKKILMNPDEKYPDLIFDTKNGVEVKKIDMDAILKNHKDLVKLIEKDINKEKIWKHLEVLANEIYEQFPKKQIWSTCIQFNGATLKQSVIDTCSDIADQDPTFQWRIWINYQSNKDFTLVIFSKDRDQAYRRGTIFTKNYFEDEKLLYFVKEVNT